jgi:hypothetical protein
MVEPPWKTTAPAGGGNRETVVQSAILPGESCAGIAAIPKPSVILAVALLLGLLS